MKTASKGSLVSTPDLDNTFGETVAEILENLAANLRCEQCGEKIKSGEDFAEVWDPTAPDLPTQIVHAETCVPDGWEVA